MKIIKSIEEMKSIISDEKSKGKSIGLVPTMGYLHDGHLSLMRRARKENDVVVASIFVNPKQFGQGEDYEVYPRDIERDSKLADSVGVDYIFAPEVKEMYPEGYNTYVEVLGVTDKLCGASRPGHFRGVTTVVTKLFNIVTPDKAYFGQKDAQQVYVVRQMVRDLNMDVNIISCPIVREHDGLAMSSRNTYLSEEERRQALVLSKSLFWAEDMINKGERDAKTLIEGIKSMINEMPLADIDYVEIIDYDTFREVEKLKGNILIALAVRIGKTRLIDNILVEVE
ncbi:pantoate--beta-alanine ligase [Caloranaerobacter azorensis DSM 13643]|uniref:Pantothenate synthetase n=1 Tax=Caloranaerobacter azorensis DSM 13643 TaxID=1121264 RepID=A0A1M5REW5_9FIRM|nr:pantoate--beta-alanine ligase [Caloranaerobacter azorensis]SHH24811.1 pantoate--beta-alanine ligase [Caloranaerobacter azorensis DSM 13643]